jgi:hypothetical protein
MKGNHLTDETLQVFILNEMQDDAITTHLEVCPACSEKLEIYQHLMADISKIAPETFSFDVTTVVMNKIIEVETRKDRNKNLVVYTSLSFVSIIALVLLGPYIKMIFAPFMSFSIITIVFMLVSVLGVATFLLNDLFRQYKQKERLLSQ